MPAPPSTVSPCCLSWSTLAYGMLSAICASAEPPEILATRAAASTIVSQFIFLTVAGRGPL